jgi:hypothetical protein
MQEKEARHLPQWLLESNVIENQLVHEARDQKCADHLVMEPSFLQSNA